MKNYVLDTNGAYDAQILQNLYAGAFGELENFLQASYQQFCLLPFATPLKKTLEQIAQEDFLHAKILAEQIVMLGQMPYMQNVDGRFLSTKQIKTETSQQSMLLIDIEMKEKSIINYKSAILKVNSKTIKKILSKIAKEEEIHLQILKNLQKQLKGIKF